MANREMFKRIRDQIKADPKAFDMGGWEYDLRSEYENFGDYDHEYYDPNIDDYQSIPVAECGTTRCAAGWAIHFAAVDAGLDVNKPLIQLFSDVAQVIGAPTRESNYESVGAKILGLSKEQAKDLFYSSDERGYSIIDEYAEGVRN